MNTIKDDAISRHGALNALCAVCGKGCDKGKFVYNAPQDDQVILCPEHYCLCALPSAQQWISCKEKLPKRTDTYLVQVGINENGEGMHTEARTAEWNAVWQTWYVHTTRCIVGDIIKWMPIPWEMR